MAIRKDLTAGIAKAFPGYLTPQALRVSVCGIADMTPKWTISSQPKGAGFTEIKIKRHGLLVLEGFAGEIVLFIVVTPLGSREVSCSVTITRLLEEPTFVKEICRSAEDQDVASTVNRLIQAVLA